MGGLIARARSGPIFSGEMTLVWKGLRNSFGRRGLDPVQSASPWASSRRDASLCTARAKPHIAIFAGGLSARNSITHTFKTGRTVIDAMEAGWTEKGTQRCLPAGHARAPIAYTAARI